MCKKSNGKNRTEKGDDDGNDDDDEQRQDEQKKTNKVRKSAREWFHLCYFLSHKSSRAEQGLVAKHLSNRTKRNAMRTRKMNRGELIYIAGFSTGSKNHFFCH